ncbi:MAG TPA: lytic murein transglycosylase B [Rhodanobacteraceae bacterium]|nr:lytic murein transglycosylase B [Rhodanobacteraceae bacterium]
MLVSPGMIRLAFLLVLLLFLPCAASAQQAVSEVHPGEAALVAEVAADTGKDAAALTRLLDGAQYQQGIIDAMTRPAESKPWSEYRPIFLTPARIDGGIAFYNEHRVLLDRISAQYGVPAPMIVAILGVETRYGKITGNYRVLDALVTLAFHYPPRAAYFRSELKTLLELPADKLAGPLDTLQGSYAGAQGWGQFMPSSIRDYAVDEDGDGHIDLLNSLPDIVASVAHYFAEHGWQSGAPVALRALQGASPDPVPEYAGVPPDAPVEQFTAAGYAPSTAVDPGLPASLLTLQGDQGAEYWLTFQNFYVITRYNKSPRYAMAVMQLAQEIEIGATQPTDTATAAEAAP